MKKILFAILVLFLPMSVLASKPAHPDLTLNIDVTVDQLNVYETQDSAMTITSGVSSEDLAKGLSTVAASGGHQFFARKNWQFSVVGSWYDDENSASFAAGRAWRDTDTFIHGSYTQNSDEHLVVIGGTFSFD